MPLSFHTARDLRERVEQLPSGPWWKFEVIPTAHPTKLLVHLYYRDALECIESLFNHPFFSDNMDFTPFRLFTTAERIVRVYTEWMSSDSAWEMQVRTHVLSWNAGLFSFTVTDTRRRHALWCRSVVG